ncbi:MAG: TonB family protein [Rikenellaceae bacterium]
MHRYYYKLSNKRSRVWGALAALLYFMVLALLLCVVSFNLTSPPPPDEGILVLFGDESESLSSKGAEPSSPPPAPSKPTPVKSVAKSKQVVATDERSEVEVPTPKQKQEVTKEQVEPQTKPEPTPEPEPRKVDKKSLFPGRVPSTNTTSSQSATAQKSGVGDGEAQGAAARAGGDVALSSASYSLSGRTLVGALPEPAYNSKAVGRVVIDVVVNEQGAVTSATYRAEGSTTTSSVLIDAARQAALKTRFSSSDDFIQGGTITYVFKLN